MMYGYNFCSIVLTFFTETSPLRTSAPLGKHMWATMDQHCVQLSFQFQFEMKCDNIMETFPRENDLANPALI